jgi:cysteine desulfurase
VTVLPVASSGLVDVTSVADAVTGSYGARQRDGCEQRDRRAAADQGTGGGGAREGRVVHTDAVQAAGKVPSMWTSSTSDFASITAHKLYGPKGCWFAVCAA